MNIDELVAAASRYLQANQLAESKNAFERVVTLVPQHLESLRQLAQIAEIERQPMLAKRYLSRALAIAPHDAELHFALGRQLQAERNSEAAIAAFRKAIDLQPDLVPAHNELGILLKSMGNTEAALAAYEGALRVDPDYVPALQNRALCLKSLRRLPEAITCLEHALNIDPNARDARLNLSNLLRLTGQPEAAERQLVTIIGQDPAHHLANYSLAQMRAQGARHGEAIELFRRALTAKPDFPEALNGLALSLREVGELSEAAARLQQAIRLRPGYATAQLNLGNVLLDANQLDAALESYTIAATHAGPIAAAAQTNRGIVLSKQGRVAEAIEQFRESTRLVPDNITALDLLVHEQQKACDWAEFESSSAKILSYIDSDSYVAAPHVVSPFRCLTLNSTAAQQLRCARRWADSISHPAVDSERSARRTKSPEGAGERIRIGYLSADFHSHATAHLVAELIELHDRSRFEIVGYSYGPDDRSTIRQRIVRAFDQFVEVGGISYRAAADRITKDKIDILVDLKGYTDGCKTEILAACREAIRVNYLGFPGTMGAPFVDYIVADDYVIPEWQREHYGEKVVYLPGCYQANDSRRSVAASLPSRAECGLPADGFVFCSFNNTYKITPEVFAVWMHLLNDVPKSVLWLLNCNELAMSNLRKAARRAGVQPDRLVFAERLASPEHLARHQCADLFLDTAPVNAHTTASDALRTGLPLLTVAGSTFASRVAGSLLRAVGLPDLVAEDLQHYYAIAFKFASQPEFAREIRKRLKSNLPSSDLYDSKKFARSIEYAYQEMLRRKQTGESPEHICVPADF